MDRMLLHLQTETVMQHMYNANITGGLFPTMWDIQDGLPVNRTREP